MEINLRNKIFCIFGLNMTGKSYLAEHIASKYNAVFFDVLNEHSDKFDSYVPKHKEYPEIANENEFFISKIQDKRKYNMIIYEEASRIFPNRKPLFPNFRAFFDTYRHKDKAIGFICRRPSQLNTDIVELSHYIFVFNLKGVNDIRYFNEINSKIEETTANLKQYSFLVIFPDRSFKVFEPVR